LKQEELKILIEGCKRNNASSQKKLFMEMYNYGMTIARRYGASLQESEEIANDGFYKAFKNIDKFHFQGPFRLWLRKIIINCAIDHFRKYSKKETQGVERQHDFNIGVQQLESDYLVKMIQYLSPQYRMVFVLHVIEGYSHEEIASKLGIKKGTSKSNLSKAKAKLKQMVLLHNENYSKNGR